MKKAIILLGFVGLIVNIGLYANKKAFSSKQRLAIIKKDIK